MSSSDRITHTKGKSEGFSIPYKTTEGKGKARCGTAIYQCHQWSSAAATTSSCPTLAAITITTPGPVPLSLLQVP